MCSECSYRTTSGSLCMARFQRALRRTRQPGASNRGSRAPLLSGLLAVAILATLLAGCGQSQSETQSSGRAVTPTHIASNIVVYPLPLGNSPAQPTGIVAGSDGAYWFMLPYTGRVGRLTPGGMFTELRLPTSLEPRTPLFSGITVGRDGGVWLADMRNGAIWRLDPATGAARSYAIPGDQGLGDHVTVFATGGFLQGIAVDRNGNIWCSDANTNELARLDPASGVVTTVALPEGSSPSDMTLGADGAIWVALANYSAFLPGGSLWIARVDPQTNTVHPFTIPHVNVNVNPPGSNPPERLTPGPDGNVWFFFNNSTDNGEAVGYISPDGGVKEFATRGGVEALATGPDGNVWYTNYDGTISRITPDGVIKDFPFVSGGGVEPYGITLGPDHNLWVSYDAPIKPGPGTPPQGKPGFQSYVAQISIAAWT